jgi:tRNA A-37 threonylcarbamoyl transferase component Bud32
LFSAGQIIGNYQILSRLGRGGMGEVYLAEHPLIGKKVALKVIHRELAGNREVVQRFFQEARAVNTIGHEHIVEIHDFGQTAQGDHFFIMEYLNGPTLATVMARARRLDVVRALHIAAQLASGLAAAHAHGVIHRDLKPDNIMLTTRQGQPDFVKILDFGLAKILASGQSPMTAIGVVLGTPQYMSPEACESKRDVDHRTDIYAVGVLLFQMLAGALPFDGDSMGEVLVKQVTQLPLAPRSLNPAIPPSVEQIILRCLAKSPAGRFATMDALHQALVQPESYLASSPPQSAARSLAPGEDPDARLVLAHAAPAVAGQRPATDHGDLGHARTVAMSAARATSRPAPPQLSPGAGGAPGRTIAADGAAMRAPDPRDAARTARSSSEGIPGRPPMIANRAMTLATPVGDSSTPRQDWRRRGVAAALLLLLAATLLLLVRRGSRAAEQAPAPDRGAGATSGAAATSGADPVPRQADAGKPPNAAIAQRSDADADRIDAVHAADAAALPASIADAMPAATSAVTIASTQPARPAATIDVTVETVPPGASIWLAGQARGIAPLTLRLDASMTQLTVEARKSGYLAKKQTVVLRGALSIQINLEKPKRSRTRTTTSRPAGNDLMRP